MNGTILDLRPIIAETLNIVLSEDLTLRLKKPTEALVLRLSELQASLNPGESDQDNKGEGDAYMIRQMDAINQLTTDVLQSNIDGREITLEWVNATLPLGAKLAILQGYSSFAMSLTTNPN